MLKRQDSFLSSSRRQQTTVQTPPPPPPPPERHAKSVGCMSGIFHLISKYQNRHKLLAFGRKHEKKAVSVLVSSPAVKEQQQKQEQSNRKIVISLLDKGQEDSDMLPRSPVLSQKILRSSSKSNVGGNNTNNNNPPALLARLMGLGEEQEQRRPVPVPAPAPEVTNDNKRGQSSSSSSSNEVKRQRLLQALEKCNEDLEALKKIIVDYKKENLHQSSMAMAKENEKNKEEIVNESGYSPLKKNFNKLQVGNGNMQQQQQGRKMVGKKPGEEDEGIEDICFLNRVLTETLRIKRKVTTTPSSSSFWSSKAMIQSVDEVCDDIAWGEKRELGNIGLTLQNQIFKDLIEDFVKEFTYHFMHRLPLDSCKRRLSFI